MKSMEQVLFDVKVANDFDRAIWKGPPPSNKARENQLQKLLNMISLSLQEDAPAAKKLILGNLEDWKSTEWPLADSQSVYVGLFFKDFPSSGDVLSSFEENKITFLLHEEANIDKLFDSFSDLLKNK